MRDHSLKRLIILMAAFSVAAVCFAENPVHGLWVWKTSSVLESPASVAMLLDFCRSSGINEVYLSTPAKTVASDERLLEGVIARLHQSNIRVEALLGSTEADLPGKPREEFLDHVQAIIQFNLKHPGVRFDGIHLDIEPQQRPENQGAGNLAFLANLSQTYRAVQALAKPAQLTVNADLEAKVLKAGPAERTLLLSSLPRFTLMLYEQSNPADGQTPAQKADKLQRVSDKYLTMAYAGLNNSALGKMAIALRTPDYLELLPEMLKTLDATHLSNPRYLGWARHSYNDHVK